LSAFDRTAGKTLSYRIVYLHVKVKQRAIMLFAGEELHDVLIYFSHFV